VALGDPSYLKHPNPVENVNKAKEILAEYFHLSSEVLDDDFFKTYLKNFEPIMKEQTQRMSQEIRNKLGGSKQTVIDITSVTLKSEKLEQFAKYLAHQTLNSDRYLLLESLIPAALTNYNNISKST